jgi:CubicO group peptidase (beta-lactamase class C family)
MLIFGAVLLIVLVGVLVYFLRIAPVGCAYKAQVLCAAHYVSGRPLATAFAPDVSADSYRIMRMFMSSHDAQRKSVTCSFLGLRPRTAVYKPGLGVAITIGGMDRRPASIPEAATLSEGEAQKLWPQGEAVGVSPAIDLAAVRACVAEQFVEHNAKRLRRTRAIAVVHDGKLICEQYAPGFAKDMPLPGWSMTKSAMATLIGARIGEGKLALKDTALLPEWCGPGDPRAKISIEDLLRMRSGLGFSEIYHDPLSDVTRMIFCEPDAAAFAARRSLAHAPGLHWQYASGTSNLLSRVLRRTFASDTDYHRYPQQALFGPAGMRSASIGTDAAGNFVGSSFMFASAGDWARLGQLLLNDGMWEGQRLLPEGWTEFSTRVTPQSPAGRYGAHWWRRMSPEFGGESAAAKHIPEDAFFALGHEGQTVSVIPSKKLVLVRLGMSIYIDAWNQAEFASRLCAAVG